MDVLLALDVRHVGVQLVYESLSVLRGGGRAQGVLGFRRQTEIDLLCSANDCCSHGGASVSIATPTVPMSGRHCHDSSSCSL